MASTPSTPGREAAAAGQDPTWSAHATAPNVPEQLRGVSTLATAPATPATLEGGDARGSNIPYAADEVKNAEPLSSTLQNAAETVKSAVGLKQEEEKPKASVIAAPRPSEPATSTRLEEKGISDLGWSGNYEKRTPIPVLHGLPNEELWLLVRRFNTQTFGVRRTAPQNIDHETTNKKFEVQEKKGVEKKPLPPPSDVHPQSVSSSTSSSSTTPKTKKQRRLLRSKSRATPIAELDLLISPNERFTPEKLRSVLERLYLTLGLGLLALFQHIARVRSWAENPVRTGALATLYFGAWALGYLETAMVGLMMLLILSDTARSWLFPPAPLAAIDTRTGKAAAPSAGHLGSADSATGGAETYVGEASEREAKHLVSAVGTLAVSTAAGSDRTAHAEAAGSARHRRKAAGKGATLIAPGSDSDSDSESYYGSDASFDEDPRQHKNKQQLPDLSDVVAHSAALKTSETGAGVQVKGGGDVGKSGAADGAQDHTKQPMEAAIWQAAGPTLHVFNELADTWERFANALEATPPFAKWLPRYRLAGALLPILLSTLVLNAQILYRSSTFLIGVLLFGQPLLAARMRIEPLIAFLDAHAPHWRERLELRNNLLKGIPTNAQLTLMLLRIGEVNSSPLPPPPPPSVKQKPSAHKGQNMAAHPDVPEALRGDMAEEAQRLQAEKEAQEAAEAKAKEEAQKQKSKGHKIRNFFFAAAKGGTKAGVKLGVEALMGANTVEAALGHLPAKLRYGVAQDPAKAEKARLGDGPISFRARYMGKRGLMFISTQATSPCVSFELVSRLTGKPKSETTALKHKLEGKEEAGVTSLLPTGKDGNDDDEKEQTSAQFSIAIEDIAEIRKIGGLSWISKLILGWSLGVEVADGLEIVDSTGKTYTLTAVNRRDEAFNRLVAIGHQRWELI